MQKSLRFLTRQIIMCLSKAKKAIIFVRDIGIHHLGDLVSISSFHTDKADLDVRLVAGNDWNGYVTLRYNVWSVC